MKSLISFTIACIICIGLYLGLDWLMNYKHDDTQAVTTHFATSDPFATHDVALAGWICIGNQGDCKLYTKNIDNYRIFWTICYKDGVYSTSISVYK